MKTPDELKELKQEVETLSTKLRELTDEELAQVTGGGKFTDIARFAQMAEQDPPYALIPPYPIKPIN